MDNNIWWSEVSLTKIYHGENLKTVELRSFDTKQPITLCRICAGEND